MSPEVWLIAEFTIKDGKKEAFKDVANMFIAAVKAKEPDALTYQFYFNNDQTKCLVLEQYRDSKAVLIHLRNVGSLVLKLLDTAQLTRGEIYGNASNELKLAVAPFGVKVFKHWGGFVREGAESKPCISQI